MNIHRSLSEHAVITVVVLRLSSTAQKRRNTSSYNNVSHSSSNLVLVCSLYYVKLFYSFPYLRNPSCAIMLTCRGLLISTYQLRVSVGCNKGHRNSLRLYTLPTHTASLGTAVTPIGRRGVESKERGRQGTKDAAVLRRKIR